MCIWPQLGLEECVVADWTVARAVLAPVGANPAIFGVQRPAFDRFLS